METKPRIAVVGTTGSGKTTLARAIAARLDIPHVELDALHWESGWQAASLEVFRARTEQALCGSGWVVDGNYSKVRDIIWGRSNTIIWLDYPFPIIFFRLMRRTYQRLVKKEELWNGNYERWGAVLSRDSLIWWAIKTYRKHRRTYPALLALPEYNHLKLLHFRSPSETEHWLDHDQLC